MDDHQLTLLAIFPHPDDESLGMGAALARYGAEGVATHLLCTTRGERGWSGPEEENPGLEALGRIREGELRCAAEQLRLTEVSLLDYIDGEVDQAQPARIIPAIVAHIRRIRPHVVVTFSPDGAYGHPDHIALAQFTAAALVCAADPSFDNPDGRAPHRVLKFYHMVDSRSLGVALREVLGGISMMVDGVQRDHFAWEEWAITTRIDAQEHFDAIWRAILCHQSQLPGFDALVALPREQLVRFFGAGTFVRIYSMVNSGRAIETDLFEGLRGESDAV